MKTPFLKFLVATVTPAIAVAEWSTRECNWDVQCEALYKPGSKCLEGGVCSNPFTAGCLNNFYSNTDQKKVTPTAFVSKRICNSKDVSTDDCEQPVLPYQEIRVHNGDWESALMYAWIIQIFLSEFLQVPTTVGMNNEDVPLTSFYAPEMPISYSAKPYPWDALITANDMGGRCELTDKDCVHVFPEVWNSQGRKLTEFTKEGHIDHLSGNGQVGKGSWYIPLHTAEQYPGLISYNGLTGQREKLASIFNRPTSWGDYCDFYSPTNCTKDDGVAVRSPADEDEKGKYFHDGLYTGFFRPTEKNDCSLNPDTCTGHIVDSPCQWDSDVFGQAYWNDIALESDGPLPENKGYSYNQMIDIWRAANATQAHVATWWWTLEPTVEEFRGTPYQFEPILLPGTTAACFAARISPEERCSLDPVIRRGPKVASCDTEAHALKTLIASSLKDTTLATPEVDRSPGYEAIKNLKVSELDMSELLRKFVAGGRTGYAARDAVCEWVIDHQDDLESFIPRGYPRVFVENASYNAPMLYVAIGFGGAAALYVLVATVMVGWYSTAKVFVYAQVPFVFMVLFGMFLVSCGSIFVALEPHDSICVSQKWFITLGYTLQMVPLLVKIAAINRVVAATQRMKSVRIGMQSLCLTVVAVVILVMIALTLWTVLDPPQRGEDRYLKDMDGVATAVVCASDSSLWDLIALCWNGVLILCATVLAFQSRNAQEEFNDSKLLGTMIYSHFIFAVLRVVTLSLSDMQISEDENGGGYPPIEPSTLAAASSFLLSLDVIAAVTIYLIPKLVTAHKAPEAHRASHGGTSYEGGSGSGGQSKTISIKKGALQFKLASDMPPSSTDRLANGADSRPGPPPRQSSLKSVVSNKSVGSGHLRVGMDGTVVQTDEDPSSSDDDDWGGPRFAAPSGSLRGGSSHSTAIHSIDEELEESTNSM